MNPSFHAEKLKKEAVFLFGSLFSCKSPDTLTQRYIDYHQRNKHQEKQIDIEYIIGIDLGTTNSCCSVYKNNQIEIIPDDKGNKYIPSYVGFTNVNKYVGFDAKNQSIINSDNVYYEVKRLIGLKYSNEIVPSNSGTFEKLVLMPICHK
jgi:hypothetical protein